MTCALHKYDAHGNFSLCGVRAVSIWKARDGDLPVCEQCEALIVEVAKGVAGVFKPIETKD